LSISEFLRTPSLPSLRKASGNGYRSSGRTNAGRQKQEGPVFSPAFSTVPTAGPSCTSVPATPTRTTARTILYAPTTRATPVPARSIISGNQVLYRIVLETIQRTLIYVRMFRKDFKLEMLAQDEESRKAELTQNEKPSPGRKNGWRIWIRLSSTSMRTTCWASCPTAGT